MKQKRSKASSFPYLSQAPYTPFVHWVSWDFGEARLPTPGSLPKVAQRKPLILALDRFGSDSFIVAFYSPGS